MKRPWLPVILVLAATAVGGIWCGAHRKQAAATAPPPEELRWEKAASSRPNTVGGVFQAKGPAGAEIHGLFVTLDASGVELREKRVEDLVPIVAQNGERLFLLHDRTEINAEDKNATGHSFSADVRLAVGDIDFCQDMGSDGLDVSDLCLHAGENPGHGVGQKIRSLLLARQPDGNFDFSAKVYEFHKAKEIVCFVLYARSAKGIPNGRG